MTNRIPETANSPTASDLDRLDVAWDRFLDGAEPWDRSVAWSQAETLRRLHARAALSAPAARRVWLGIHGSPRPIGVRRPSPAPGLLPLGGESRLARAVAIGLLVATLLGLAGSLLGGRSLPGGTLFGPETTAAAPASAAVVSPATPDQPTATTPDEAPFRDDVGERSVKE